MIYLKFEEVGDHTGLYEQEPQHCDRFHKINPWIFLPIAWNGINEWARHWSRSNSNSSMEKVS
jgi:hypothetical protein